VFVDALGKSGKGKSDVFQAFLARSLDATASNGLLLFVLPQTFLSGQSSESIRLKIARDFSIELLADLSNIEVFENTGAYVILLVLRKSRPVNNTTIVVRCRDFPGQALNEALYGREHSNTYFQVFRVAQDSLTGKEWKILPAREMDLFRRL